MSLRIVRHDITLMRCDAIVCPTDELLSGGGGLDEDIILHGGELLRKARATIGRLATTETAVTLGFDLPSSYVIHTVGPVWVDGTQGEEKELAACYTNCLNEALKHRCESIAIPLISCGRFGFPQERALSIAMLTIGEFLMKEEMLVYLVVYDRTSHKISSRLMEIEEYIDDNYVVQKASRSHGRLEHENLYTEQDDNLLPVRPRASRAESFSVMASCVPPVSEPCDDYFSCSDDSAFSQIDEDSFLDEDGDRVEYSDTACEAYSPQMPSRSLDAVPPSFQKSERARSLEEMIAELKQRRFADTLFRLIDESGMTDVECYKRANVDKKTFSKIKCNEKYNPSKRTILAFAIALRLTMEKTQELLAAAGYTLGRGSIFDIILEYFIINEKYNIFEINEALFYYDQPILGS